MFGHAVFEEKMFEIDDEDNKNANDDGLRSMGILYISSSCELVGSGELTKSLSQNKDSPMTQ